MVSLVSLYNLVGDQGSISLYGPLKNADGAMAELVEGRLLDLVGIRGIYQVE